MVTWLSVYFHPPLFRRPKKPPFYGICMVLAWCIQSAERGGGLHPSKGKLSQYPNPTVSPKSLSSKNG